MRYYNNNNSKSRLARITLLFANFGYLLENKMAAPVQSLSETECTDLFIPL